MRITLIVMVTRKIIFIWITKFVADIRIINLLKI